MLIVQKFPGANTMEVTEGVEHAIDELRPGLPGMEIDTTIFRPATFIEKSIDNLTTALLSASSSWSSSWPRSSSSGGRRSSA